MTEHHDWLDADVPHEARLIDAGRELMESSETWRHNRMYAKGTVKGFVHPKESDDLQPWFCRVSEHGPDEATFEELWYGLGVNKAEHEKK